MLNRKVKNSRRRRAKDAEAPDHPFSPSPRHLVPPPQKRFGQNFLINQGIVDRIIDALAPGPAETIVEIGPGQGALTSQLVERAGSVVAIEFDRNLITFLQTTFREKENFKLIADDALAVDFCAAIQPASDARVVANLPYNISTAILQRLIAQRACLPEMILMLQREVVERIAAAPGSKERGYLSVLVEAYCKAEKLFDVAPGSFRPAPKVWSSVVRLRRKEKTDVPRDEDLFWELASAGFAQKRKTILNNLRHTPAQLTELIKGHGGASIILCRAGIELQRRAETLTLEEWVRLARTLE